MRYAVIEGNLVVNVILLEDLDDYESPSILVLSETANIGDRWNGRSFVAAPTQKQPNWDLFNKTMQSNTAYNRVVGATTSRQAVDRLEAIAIALGIKGDDAAADYTIIAGLWNSMIAGITLLSKPSPTEIAAWKNAAISADMPFTFNSAGEMINA